LALDEEAVPSRVDSARLAIRSEEWNGILSEEKYLVDLSSLIVL
jgi:hypothetical protein